MPHVYITERSNLVMEVHNPENNGIGRIWLDGNHLREGIKRWFMQITIDGQTIKMSTTVPSTADAWLQDFRDGISEDGFEMAFDATA